MTVYGWDASDYDWGRGPVDLEAARKSGISLFTHKVSEGKSGWFRAVHAGEAFKRADAAKIPVVGGYHVLHPADMGSIADQADWYLSCLDDAWGGWRKHPCFIHQIDAEKFSYMTREPNLAEIHGFAGIIVAKTGCAPTQVVVYAPQWLYGERLKGLQYPLWASAYVGGSGPFKRLYPGDRDAKWAAYSDIAPTLLQYSSASIIGTQHTCDANAVRVGSEDELAALFLGDDMPTADEIAKAVKQVPITKDGDSLAEVLRQILAAQDPARLAKAVKAELGGSADEAAIEAALRKVFADAGDAK